MNQFLQAKNGEFVKVIDHFKKDIGTLRTGRANPGMLEGIAVESYGIKTPINGVASISVQDAQSLIIAPWDRSLVKEIEKALVEANLGVGVINEGDKVRLTIPRMTEENRRELVKKLNERMEKTRISLRQARDEIKNAIEAAEKAKTIPEDDKFRFMKELDEEVARRNEELKTIKDKKEQEIMTI